MADNEDEFLDENEEDTEEVKKVKRSFKNLLNRHNGDAMNLATTLFTENAELRAKRRDIQNQLNSSKLAEGEKKLTKAEAEAYEAYLALGPVAELTQSLTKKKELEERITQVEQAEQMAKVAGALSFNVEVLTPLLNPMLADGSSVVFEKEKIEGTDFDVPYLVKGTTKKKISEIATETWKPFLPALQITDSDEEEKDNGIQIIHQGSPKNPGNKNRNPARSLINKKYSLPKKGE